MDNSGKMSIASIDTINWGNIYKVTILDWPWWDDRELFIKLTDIDRQRLQIFYAWQELPLDNYELIEIFFPKL